MNAVFPGEFDERFFAFDQFQAALNWMEPGMDVVRFTSRPSFGRRIQHSLAFVQSKGRMTVPGEAVTLIDGTRRGEDADVPVDGSVVIGVPAHPVGDDDEQVALSEVEDAAGVFVFRPFSGVGPKGETHPEPPLPGGS
ncbi:hypothetical protein, partial [Hydrogenibacillus schlegelii]|uniref:hypothetical protein n=1 Tax=Hydrogenibacillus schlegelii TaxID=1484 RepID=UPI0034A00F04